MIGLAPCQRGLTHAVFEIRGDSLARIDGDGCEAPLRVVESTPTSLIYIDQTEDRRVIYDEKLSPSGIRFLSRTLHLPDGRTVFSYQSLKRRK